MPYLSRFIGGLVGTLIGAVLGVLITLKKPLGQSLSAVNQNGVFLPTSIEPLLEVIVIVFSLLLSLGYQPIYLLIITAKTETSGKQYVMSKI